MLDWRNCSHTIEDMKHILSKNCKNIVVILLITMFFSCVNNPKEVRDFLADRNLPIAVGKNIHHSYRDSGVVTSKLITPVLNDYTNRKKHPFNEFPQGIKIITFDATKGDSTTITGNYALTFLNTKISDIRDNVVIVNHSGDTKLETNQLYWDQKEKVVQ